MTQQTIAIVTTRTGDTVTAQRGERTASVTANPADSANESHLAAAVRLMADLARETSNPNFHPVRLQFTGADTDTGRVYLTWPRTDDLPEGSAEWPKHYQAQEAGATLYLVSVGAQEESTGAVYWTESAARLYFDSAAAHAYAGQENRQKLDTGADDPIRYAEPWDPCSVVRSVATIREIAPK